MFHTRSSKSRYAGAAHLYRTSSAPLQEIYRRTRGQQHAYELLGYADGSYDILRDGQFLRKGSAEVLRFIGRPKSPDYWKRQALERAKVNVETLDRMEE